MKSLMNAFNNGTKFMDSKVFRDSMIGVAVAGVLAAAAIPEFIPSYDERTSSSGVEQPSGQRDMNRTLTNLGLNLAN